MIIRSLVFLVLLTMAVPFLLQTAYGLYYGLDVRNGITWTIRHFSGMDTRVFRSNMPVATNLLEIERLSVTWNGDIENESLEEASGLAASRTNPGLLYSVNDSGNEPRLYAMGMDGRDLGSWHIDYQERHDFEELATFNWEGRNFVLVADTGDNFYWRPSLRLLAIPEPHLGRDAPDSTLSPEWVVNFIFPDGSRDIEALAVDPESESIWLVSKRQVPAELFRLPLKPDKTVTAIPVGYLSLPQPTLRDLREDPRYGFGRSMPTAMDMNGRSAVVQTYRDAYLYHRGLMQTWEEAFSTRPTRIPLPQINGLESAAFSVDGDQLIVTGERDEGDRMGIYQVDL